MKKTLFILVLVIGAAALLWYFGFYLPKQKKDQQQQIANLLADYNKKVNAVNLPVLQKELESKIGKTVYVEWSNGVKGGPLFTLTKQG